MSSRLSTSQGGVDLGLPNRRKDADSSRPGRKSKIPGANGFSRVSGIPVGGGRQSTLGSSRLSSLGGASAQSVRRGSRSSVYGQGGPTVKKDPRPLSDKHYQQTCIRKLCSFLIERNYPRDVKPKSLQTPSTKEFLYILNFILEQLDPSMMISGIKMEEEIPYILKLLRYPFTVSKNHLLSVGSPHSWPIMLGVLMWLMDGVQMNITSQLLFPVQEGFDEDKEKELSNFEFTSETYLVFLQEGVDSENYQYLFKHKEDTLRTVCEDAAQRLQEEFEEHDKLLLIKDKLSESSIGTLQDKLSDVKSVYESVYQHVNTELVPQIEDTEKAIMEIQKNITHGELQILSSKEKAVELIEYIKTQPMSAKEAQELHQKIKDKQDTRDTMKKRVHEDRENISELQMKHNRMVSAIDKACKEVNDTLRRLVCLVNDAACIQPMDYNTSKRADPGVLTQLLQQSKIIKNGIYQLNEKVAMELSEMDNRQIDAEAAKSSLQNELIKKQVVELQEAEHIVEREKRILEQTKKNREMVMKSQLEMKVSLENEVLSLRQCLQENDREKELIAIRTRVEEETTAMASDIDKKTNIVQDYCVLLTQYLESVKVRQRKVREDLDQLVLVYKNIKPPAIKAKYYKLN